MPVESVYQPVAESQFPERPSLEGRITTMPKETFLALQIVAGCVSTDATRYVLNGVLFSPDDGGTLIATDGRLLAGAPARFAGREFILPSVAAHVLAYPDFTARDAAILQAEESDKEADKPLVQFRSGPHTLIARAIEGNYPNYRQVIPHEFLADATIPETHRSALISWLKTLDGRSTTVRLTWETPGHLTLTHWDSGTAQATIRVPVSTSGEGQPPAISFGPRYLAEALAIGPVLRLIDGISLGLTAGPSGNEAFCVIMPCRFTEVAEENAESGHKAAAPAPAMAA
jgi:DNA polymerase-3 subunit beta